MVGKVSRYVAADAAIHRFAGGKDLVTLANVVFGFAAIVFTYQHAFLYAAAALVAAVVADAADGWVARTFFEPNTFGKRMDFADLVSFGAAPAFLIVIWLGVTPLTFTVAAALVSGGLLRLARFQTREETGTGFVGVPITVNGVLFPGLVLIDAPASVVIAAAVFMTVLMVSSLKLPKLPV